MRTAVHGKRRYQSDIQFPGYRKYQADTAIRFDGQRAPSTTDRRKGRETALQPPTTRRYA
jgi:hypothetical protein